MRGAVLLAGLSVACAPIPAQSMSDIEFPPGFELQTTREVVLTVRGHPAGPDARMMVHTPDGAPLYDGGVGLAVRHPLRLRVPTGTTSIDVTVGDRVDRIAVVDARVDLDLGAAP